MLHLYPEVRERRDAALASLDKLLGRSLGPAELRAQAFDEIAQAATRMARNLRDWDRQAEEHAARRRAA